MAEARGACGKKKERKKKLLISLSVRQREGHKRQTKAGLHSQGPRCWSDRGHIFLSAHYHCTTHSHSNQSLNLIMGRTVQITCTGLSSIRERPVSMVLCLLDLHSSRRNSLMLLRPDRHRQEGSTVPIVAVVKTDTASVMKLEHYSNSTKYLMILGH